MRDISGTNYPLTFTQYNNIFAKVVDDVIKDGVYHPELKDLSLRLCIVLVFNDDVDFSKIETNDEIYAVVNNGDNVKLWNNFRNTEQGYELIDAIENEIEYRKNIYSNSGAMSMSDYAISQIIERFGEKFGELNLDADTITNMAEVFSDKNALADNLVNAMAKGGYLNRKE